MTTAYFKTTLWFFIVLGSFFAAQAQNPEDTATFSKGDISFTYPAGWRVTDKSTKDIEQLNIMPDSGNVLIMITSLQRKVITEKEFNSLKEQISNPRTSGLASSLKSFTESGVCVDFQRKKIPGQSIVGIYRTEQATSQFFSLVINEKFFNLVYFKEDKESHHSDPGWQMILNSLQLKKSAKTPSLLLDTNSDAVLNGKALKLPRPHYPPFLNNKFGERGGTIVVRVTIDPNGDVIAAKYLSAGSGLAGPDASVFAAQAVQAAKQAKFAPSTVCGEPATITGLIEYSFDVR